MGDNNTKIPALAIDAVKADMQNVVDTITAGTRQKLGLNYFYATGMTTQEIRHSSFLAFLLDAQQTHGLGDAMLTRLLYKLYNMPCRHTSTAISSNKHILDTTTASNTMYQLANSVDIEVSTELCNTNDARRKDIFVLSNNCKTTLTIENKTFSTTHDDQLKHYQDDINANYNPLVGWKNIFVYLSPKGDIPLHIDNSYAQNWCIMDYTTVRDICTEIVYDIKAKTLSCHNKTKLTNILGDYIDMINTELLQNKDVFQLYRTLTKKTASQQAIDLLVAYNHKDTLVQQHCKQWLNDNLPTVGYELIDSDNKIKRLHSATVDVFFGENTSSQYSCIFLYDSGEYKCIFAIHTTNKCDWNDKQLYLANTSAIKNTTYTTIAKVSLITDTDLRTKDDADMVAQLNSGLEQFMNKLKEINEKIASYQ